MTRGGKPNFEGVNSQVYAALSLFLQNLSRSDFVEMRLEADNLEDFVLVYDSGKKIICESKIRKNGVTLSDLKKIMDAVIKHGELTKTDELLIISNRFEERVGSLVKNFVFWDERALQDLKNKSPYFNEIHFSLIPQVKLWEVSQDTNKNGIIFLLHQALSQSGPFWIPMNRLEELVDNLLIQDIYQNSQKGLSVTKSDFLKKLDIKKNEYFKNGGVNLEIVKNNSLKKVEYIVELVARNDPTQKEVCANAISELIANPVLHHEAIRRLSLSSDLNLKIWSELWNATVSSINSFQIFKIFQNNISNEENQEYAIEFIDEILDQYLISYHREDFIKNDITDLCEKILNFSPLYAHKIFDITKRLFDYSTSSFFYKERKYRDNTWGMEQVANFLQKLYNSSVIDKNLKYAIYNFVIGKFNLVDDDSKYWHYSPPSIFSIISSHVNDDPKSRIVEFTKVASEQNIKTLRRYSKKVKFEGWEHMGGGISQSGDVFEIEDKHFVTKVLQPALELIPEDEKWSFILTNLLILDQNLISADKPDFLNRACIPYLLSEYIHGDHVDEAFQVLRTFIITKKGIPWKADIIYQTAKVNNLPPDKMWKLIQISLDEYINLPVNVFVEQMVTDIANNDSAGEYQNKAVETLKAWSKDPNYRKNRSLGSYDVIDSVFRLLNNSKTFEYGVEILNTHINSEDFKQSEDTYGSWDVSKALALVLAKDCTMGVKMLNDIEKQEILGVNQQIVLLDSLSDLTLDNPKVITQTYHQFVEPFLKKHVNQSNIEKRFTHSYAREGLVKYAELLAKTKQYLPALTILKFTINDSDPTQAEHNDNIDEHNLHQRVMKGEDCNTITSVRGYTSWALRYFSMLPAREYYPEALDLVEKLTKDPNYYIRLQSTYPLIDFVKNKDTYIAETDPKERFVSERVSKKAEDITFSMINDTTNQTLPAVLKGLVHVFSEFRQMNHHQALEIINIFLSSDSEEVLHDATSLLLFSAEFRKGSFKKWQWEKLPEFDDTEFKKIINEQIRDGKSAIRNSLSSEFWRLPKQGKGDTSDYDNALFMISTKYFKKCILGDYDKDVWEDIYRFIEEYIDDKYSVCIKLWKSCLKKERPCLTEAMKVKENFHDLYWRPFFYNGKILITVLKNEGLNEFLKWLEFLIDYPDGVLIANDLDIAVTELAKQPKGIDVISKLFDKLVTRFPKYYDMKYNWEHINSETEM